MNTTFNIKDVIDSLKNKRKIFTSEADLQLELAGIIKDKYKNATVRLEYCPDFDSSMHIDILVIIDRKWIPIELKYKTKKFYYKDTDGCVYNLKEQSAHDCGCYDYIKDIKRIEKIKDQKKEDFEVGYTIFITNDELYKNGPRSKSSYKAFSLKEYIPSNKLKWTKGKVVSKERNESITLNREYNIRWQDFYKFSDDELEYSEKAKTFYILINEIH